jgi:hypothetical protein
MLVTQQKIHAWSLREIQCCIRREHGETPVNLVKDKT